MHEVCEIVDSLYKTYGHALWLPVLVHGMYCMHVCTPTRSYQKNAISVYWDVVPLPWGYVCTIMLLLTVCAAIDWGEPERTPHKQYMCTRIVCMYVWNDCHSSISLYRVARNVLHCIVCMPKTYEASRTRARLQHASLNQQEIEI